MKNYIWPLSAPSFTFLDKLRIAKFILTEDKWTQGKYVLEYEKKWEKYTGAKHALMVSSGSTANELLALRRKYELQQSGDWPKKNKVVFPAITWISSVSPWVNLGFEPVFVDVSGVTMNATQIDIVLKVCDDETIGTVFYTSLLGFSEDLVEIKKICDHIGVRLMLDNCESSFSYVPDSNGKSSTHICAFAPSSTSLYFSHLTTTGTEGGLVFCETDEEYEWFLMARSHGMTRGLPEKYRNPDVDPMFDFHLMGSNYRSHNLAAYMGMLDFDRALQYSTNLNNCNSRIRISKLFSDTLREELFYKPHQQTHDDNIAFCLPVVARARPDSPEMIKNIRSHIESLGVETRPLVSGNLLHQTAFKKYGNPQQFPHAEFLHKNAFYIGLFNGVKEKNVINLASLLNVLAMKHYKII